MSAFDAFWVLVQICQLWYSDSLIMVNITSLTILLPQSYFFFGAFQIENLPLSMLNPCFQIFCSYGFQWLKGGNYISGALIAKNFLAEQWVWYTWLPLPSLFQASGVYWIFPHFFCRLEWEKLSLEKFQSKKKATRQNCALQSVTQSRLGFITKGLFIERKQLRK